jgi:hypothetical protein
MSNNSITVRFVAGEEGGYSAFILTDESDGLPKRIAASAPPAICVSERKIMSGWVDGKLAELEGTDVTVMVQPPHQIAARHARQQYPDEYPPDDTAEPQVRRGLLQVFTGTGR